MEAIYITAAEAGCLKGTKPLFGINREYGESIRSEGMGMEKNASGNTMERGITFDLKNGKVELWKKEQSVKKEEQSVKKEEQSMRKGEDLRNTIEKE